MAYVFTIIAVVFTALLAITLSYDKYLRPWLFSSKMKDLVHDKEEEQALNDFLAKDEE